MNGIPNSASGFDRRVTASEISRCGGTSRFAVHRELAAVPSSSTISGGNEAKAWRVATLPEETRDRIDPYDLTALDAIRESWKDPYSPTEYQVELLLDCAFLKLESLVKNGAGESVQKARQLDWLWKNTPFLAESPEALRRMFNRYLGRWREGGFNGLFDKRRRAGKSKRAPKLPKQDLDIIVWTGLKKTNVKLSANEAWQLSWHRLSEETRTRYPLRREIPATVRKQVLPEMERLLDYHIRPGYARLNGASVEQDHSFYHAGDVYSADDVTLEVYFYVNNEKGFSLTRGQFIAFIDVRSKKILDFVLVPYRSFTSSDIRILTTKVCERYGIPRLGFHFERSIFDAKLTGRGAYVDPYEDRRETFADRLGIRIIQALPGNARAKLIENVNGLLQRLMPGEPGYVGPNERAVSFEHVQSAMQQVHSGKARPADLGFRSFDEWFQRLSEIVEEYNGRMQSSRVMGGNKPVDMSPNQAWEALQPKNEKGEVCGITKVTNENRYLLACHLETRKITREGITLQFGSAQYRYLGTETGRRRGEMVRVWFDPDRPQSIIITDLKGEDMAIVEEAPRARAFVSTAEEIRAAMRPVRAHERAIKERYSELKTMFVPPAGRQLGRSERGLQMEALRAQLVEDKRVKTREELEESARLNRLKLAELREFERNHPEIFG